MNRINKVLINGDFFCRRRTGIERYAYEITSRLDNLIQKDEIAIIVPSNAPELPQYKNIKIIRHKSKLKSRMFWQMVTMQFFLIKHKEYIALEFHCVCLPFVPCITVLHDIYCEFYPEDFKSMLEKVDRLRTILLYRIAAYCAKKIVTVSEFSKNQIAKTYRINPDRISVIYSAWNHFGNVIPDYSIFEDFPVLANPFYFSLGTLVRRRNIKWIIKNASLHSDMLFAISGQGGLEDAPSNVILLGFLDDAKVKALMQKCKAFILPSYYEGFGLTPLEALSCGAKIIIAKAASLPEIYGDSAHYIDPYDTNVDLDELLKQPVSNPQKTLAKYSYDKSAADMYELIKSVIQK